MASFVDLFQRRFGPITTTKLETDILFDTWQLWPYILIANWGDYDILLNWNRLHLKNYFHINNQFLFTQVPRSDLSWVGSMQVAGYH